MAGRKGRKFNSLDKVNNNENKQFAYVTKELEEGRSATVFKSSQIRELKQIYSNLNVKDLGGMYIVSAN